MKNVLRASRYLVLIAVVSSLAASGAAFFWGAYKTVLVILSLVTSAGKDPLAAIALIELMDTFLIAVALFIFSVGMYELFIEELELPSIVAIQSLHDLKAKLSSVIVLVLAVTFLKLLVERQDPQGTLFIGIAVAVVTTALIAFSHYGGKD